jgi:BirA family transcriptional regulator, biotin operon repressor / biotin---[acetyl-CoA-carboxylase] ligase
VIGSPRRHVAECESTQTLLGPADPEGSIATSDHQTAGRGRLGRSWVEAPGTSVIVSVLLRPPPERRAPEISLVGAVAVALAVEDTTGRDAQIKWPNDVLLAGCKVAGILAEMRDDVVILGIGLNVNQTREQLPEDAKVEPASLRTVDGRVRDREEVLTTLLHRLETCYRAWRAGGLASIHQDLDRRDFLRGRSVTVEGIGGVASGIDRAGRLVVAGEAGPRVVESGEVLFER